MSSYHSLARWYDSLTGDVPYDAFVRFYEEAFAADGSEFSLLLDLCCGTGTLTYEMAKKGYDLIGADASPDMLSFAMQKSADYDVFPLFLCQRAEELDLYGTVDAAFSSLDSMNYIPEELLPEIFRRLHLFIRPGGLFIFDIRSEEWLRSLNGLTSVDEDEDVFCLWRADFDENTSAITYGMDLFSRCGDFWERSQESHTEYAHRTETLAQLLSQAGFDQIRIRKDGPQGELGRVFILCRRSI